jgi:uncharacterized protein (UPF0212 family)
METNSMDQEEKLKIIINKLMDPLTCDKDGTRIRFGDLECPRCGSDIELLLQGLGETILSNIEENI